MNAAARAVVDDDCDRVPSIVDVAVVSDVAAVPPSTSKSVPSNSCDRRCRIERDRRIAVDDFDALRADRRVVAVDRRAIHRDRAGVDVVDANAASRSRR